MGRDDFLTRKRVSRNADADVVEWVWEPEALTFNPRPLFGERSGVRASRAALQPLPVRPAGGLAYGLAADGEALVARGYDGRGDVRQEAFAHVDGGRKTWQTFVADVDLALRTIVESEVVREVESYARDERGRIVRIVVDRDMGFEDDPRREEYVVTYDDGDEPLAITEIAVPGGIVFDRTARPRARDMKYVVRELVAGISDEVMRIGTAEQVRCVVLSCESGGEAVPLIGIGVVSELDDSGALWNPAEFRYSIGITKEFEARDPGRFEAACQALERGWRAHEGDDASLRLGYRVAHELNNRAWPAGTVSEEFVAIAVDETLDRLVEQARLSAPLERIEPVIAKYMHD
jgi:hypothetical protein